MLLQSYIIQLQSYIIADDPANHFCMYTQDTTKISAKSSINESYILKNSTPYCSPGKGMLTWLGVVLLRCSVGADSPSSDLRGRTSGVLLVLLAEDPEMEAWTEATTLACSGGTNLQSLRGNYRWGNRRHTACNRQRWMYTIHTVPAYHLFFSYFSWRNSFTFCGSRKSGTAEVLSS